MQVNVSWRQPIGRAAEASIQARLRPACSRRS